MGAVHNRKLGMPSVPEYVGVLAQEGTVQRATLWIRTTKIGGNSEKVSGQEGRRKV